jgi:diguanylate cyclase (GGDEF)-like protein
MSKVKVFIDLFNAKRDSNKLLLSELASAKATLEEKNRELEFIAKHDLLTMLPNRLAFEVELKRISASSRRFKRNFAILFIDLDNFKWINDNYGHDYGDVVLGQVASIVKASIREEDFVARIGGDEFAVILTDLDREESSAIVAEKILNNIIAKPFHVFNEFINITVSLGISSYPSCTDSAKMLVKQADIAMYRAKSLGRNNYCFFSDEINTSFNNINSIRDELQSALKKNELYLNYQPIVNLKDSKIVGLESLLRWKSPKLGLIPPAEFIFLAEETRLIHEIGLWVIEETCKFIKKCKDVGVSNIFFSINLSPRQLEQETFTENLSSVLKKHETNPAQIDLELTESNLSSFLTSSNKNYLLFLKQTHLRLSIDDFGTGYSSLDRLANLPINTLKIDGSFVSKINSDEKSNTIIKGIVALSKSLNMKTIAECVETKEQAEFLLNEGCELAQGFYYYKPMSDKKLLNILKKDS